MKRALLPLLLAAVVPASAQRVVSPVVTRSAVVPVIPVIPQTGVRLNPLLPVGSWTTPALQASNLNPSLTLSAPALPAAPAILEAQAPAVLSEVPMLPAALPAAGMQAASLKAADIQLHVQAALDEAGPIKQASPQEARGLGSEVFSRLIGEKTAALPAGDGVDAAAPSAPNALQRKMLQALGNLASIYMDHYAPIEWKESRFGADLRAGYDKIRQAVLAKPGMTNQEFHVMLVRFIDNLRDYHAGIQFFNTERSGLPFTVMGAKGKYFIVHVDRAKVSEKDFPYQPGDEVVEFGGKPTGQVVKSLEPSVPAVAETDARTAEMRLTSRIRQLGMDVPQGEVALKIRTKDGAVHDVKMDWTYKPEQVPQNVAVRDGLGPESFMDDFVMDGPARTAKPSILDRFFNAFVHPAAKLFRRFTAKDPDNPFRIGARKSYVPDLGKKIWEIPGHSPLYAAIYEDAEGRKIGFLRIPDYMGEQQHLQIAAQVLMKFQAETDGLVIDQVNNPGGNMFYLYALASMMTDKPLAVPKHRVLIDEGDAFWAAQLLEQAKEPGGLMDLEGEFDERMKAMMMMSMMGGNQNPVLEYARFILSELKAGRRLTNPTALFGTDQVDPQPMVRYTKPITVLINEMDFSGGDFFPAIMQDNGRATLLGVRTAGAGGGVKELDFPNQVGIAGYSYTWTIAERLNGQPIENLGVTPDIPYQLTADDLQNGFRGYKKTILDAVAAQVPAPAAVKVEAPEVDEAAEGAGDKTDLADAKDTTDPADEIQ